MRITTTAVGTFDFSLVCLVCILIGLVTCLVILICLCTASSPVNLLMKYSVIKGKETSQSKNCLPCPEIDELRLHQCTEHKGEEQIRSHTAIMYSTICV